MALWLYWEDKYIDQVVNIITAIIVVRSMRQNHIW